MAIKNRFKISKKVMLSIFVLICVLSATQFLSADGSGVVGINPRTGAPTVTYNVRGLTLGEITKNVDGKAENIHVYSNGTFEPGIVEFWGTISHNSENGPAVYNASLQYFDSTGKLIETPMSKIPTTRMNPRSQVDYKLTATLPENTSYVQISLGCVDLSNAYVRSTVTGNFYRVPRPVGTPDEKRVGINSPSNSPTITYNVQGINLGTLKIEKDGVAENRHYYDSGQYTPGPVEFWGTVRNNAVAGSTIFYNALIQYTGPDGKNYKQETKYIYVGPSYTSEYRIATVIPVNSKNVFMEVSAVERTNAYIRSTVNANLTPAPAAVPVPVVTTALKPSPTAADKNTGTNSAQIFESGIRISWASSNTLGYRLFRSTSQAELGISVTDFYIEGTSYADVNVEPNTTYYYSVKPVLAEARPLQSIDEQLGNVIATFTVKTSDQVYQKGSYKNFVLLKLNSPYMSVNGVTKEVDPGRGTAPILISGRSMVPIKSIVEAMGGSIDWDSATQKVTLKAKGNTVEMWLNKTTIKVNGTNKIMDVAPVSKNGRTYVPLRFAAENLNCKVDWINSTSEAVIVFVD